MPSASYIRSPVTRSTHQSTSKKPWWCRHSRIITTSLCPVPAASPSEGHAHTATRTYYGKRAHSLTTHHLPCTGVLQEHGQGRGGGAGALSRDQTLAEEAMRCAAASPSQEARAFRRSQQPTSHVAYHHDHSLPAVAVEGGGQAGPSERALSLASLALLWMGRSMCEGRGGGGGRPPPGRRQEREEGNGLET